MRIVDETGTVGGINLFQSDCVLLDPEDGRPRVVVANQLLESYPDLETAYRLSAPPHGVPDGA